MVRRGSTVRVRQRACRKGPQARAFCIQVCIQTRSIRRWSTSGQLPRELRGRERSSSRCSRGGTRRLGGAGRSSSIRRLPCAPRAPPPRWVARPTHSPSWSRRSFSGESGRALRNVVRPSLTTSCEFLQAQPCSPDHWKPSSTRQSGRDGPKSVESLGSSRTGSPGSSPKYQPR